MSHLSIWDEQEDDEYYDSYPFYESREMPKNEKKYGSIIGIAIIGGLGFWLGGKYIIKPKPVDPVPVVVVGECICEDGMDPNCEVCKAHMEE
jgi:hypothetical protein